MNKGMFFVKKNLITVNCVNCLNEAKIYKFSKSEIVCNFCTSLLAKPGPNKCIIVCKVR